MQRAVAHQDEAGVVGHLPPFVEIERDRIGLLDAGKPRRDIRRHDGKRADGAIDVEPYFFAPRDRSQRGEIVDGAGVDRARGTDHEERRQARDAILHDRQIERVDVDLIDPLVGMTCSASMPRPDRSIACAMQPCAAADA